MKKVKALGFKLSIYMYLQLRDRGDRQGNFERGTGTDGLQNSGSPEAAQQKFLIIFSVPAASGAPFWQREIDIFQAEMPLWVLGCLNLHQ